MDVNNGQSDGPTVCVIGCGPGGMFFLHALASRRKKLLEEGNTEALSALPVVTCYEQSHSPGGVWRSAKARLDMHEQSSLHEIEPATMSLRKEEKSKRTPAYTNATTPTATTETKTQAKFGDNPTNMYEALWINGQKEGLEFPDYTFHDHFKKETPVYLPRKQVFEYILARVTTVENIFTHVHFETSVTLCKYNEASKKFDVTVLDHQTGQAVTNQFDKCIWSAGLNGKPKIPQNIKNQLIKGHFSGSIIHSTQMDNFEESVRGKRILFIGTAYSAEDLALQSIKLGAEHITIIGRGAAETCGYVAAWPCGKVNVVPYCQLCGVSEDGKGILVAHTEWNDDIEQYEVQDEGEAWEIPDISTVVFCTGYSPSVNMLAPELALALQTEKNTKRWSLPDDWEMKRNIFTETFGNVTPAKQLNGYESYIKKRIYRGLLIDNLCTDTITIKGGRIPSTCGPNMMYLHERTSFPLLDIDVRAWLLLAFICGDAEIPTKEKMMRENLETTIDSMHIPYLRYFEDPTYEAKIEALEKESPCWYKNHTSPEYLKSVFELYEYETRLLAHDMETGGYPASFGSYTALNSTGKKFADLTVQDCLARYELKNDSRESTWRTFRDCDSSRFSSIFTGTPSCALEGPWMELDADGKRE